MLERAEEDRCLDDIASLLVHLMPGGWELASLSYRAVGTSFEYAVIGGGLVHPRLPNRHNEATPTRMREAEELLPLSGVHELLRDLRSRMHEKARGTWLEMNLKVRCRAGETSDLDGPRPLWGVSYKYADEISWADEVPPAAAAEELLAHPQDAQDVPEWLGRLAMVQAPADRFDSGELLRSPQRESDLVAALPEGLADLFAASRALLLDVLEPEEADRFLVGRLADGHWSVVHAAPSWLAVRMEDGAGAEVHAFEEARSAAAFAIGAVLAEAGAEVNSTVLTAAGVLSMLTAPRKGVDTWTLGDYQQFGTKQMRRSRSVERPSGAAARGRRYIRLSTLHNRPGGYFVCRPGPVPSRGDFVSTHEIFRRCAEKWLPKARPPVRERPVAETFPTEVLEPGTELDAYGEPDRDVLFTIGTPFSRRGLYGTPEQYAYHVYRVQRPFEVSPGLFTATPIFPTGQDRPAEEERPAGTDGRGFYVSRPIADLLRSGELVEITGPGGEPVQPAGNPTGSATP
ncbi:glycohydrolase toxin TNT-related protein [Actinomadura sp. 9N407]|uniref:glycohydrolase toxin TNT-related protein n=1 Tax=Actinomadura sp. 9N407 TaxID=3375154 RepID=UPI0037A61CB6